MVGDRKIFPTQYEYDGLDRRDSKCTSAEEGDCGGGRRSDLAYVGLTQFLSAETPLGGAGEPASTEKARDFDYDADFDSLGVASKAEGETAAAYRAYSKDANGSVEGLEQGNGEIKKAIWPPPSRSLIAMTTPGRRGGGSDRSEGWPQQRLGEGPQRRRPGQPDAL